MSTNATRQCLQCQKELKGRADQKFCNDSCRNTYRFKLNSQKKDYFSATIAILKKNREVLAALSGEFQYGLITKERMLMDGFNFKHCTEHRVWNENDYYFCFDYGFIWRLKDLYEVIYKSNLECEMYFEEYFGDMKIQPRSENLQFVETPSVL